MDLEISRIAQRQGRINHSGPPYQRKAGPFSHVFSGRALFLLGVHFSSPIKVDGFFSRRRYVYTERSNVKTAW